jgi:DNA repair protein RadC
MPQLSLQINTVDPLPPEHGSTRYIIETIRVQLNAAESPPTQRVDSVNQATTILHRLFANLEPDQEHFLILGLNTKNTILSYKLIASGGQADTVVDPKLVFRHALLMGASRIILSHSHPSGDPTPSAEDRRVTKVLTRAGRDLDLPVIDHIIIAPPDRSYSFAQSSCMPT